jgi:hypothetical protein
MGPAIMTVPPFAGGSRVDGASRRSARAGPAHVILAGRRSAGARQRAHASRAAYLPAGARRAVHRMDPHLMAAGAYPMRRRSIWMRTSAIAEARATGTGCSATSRTRW